MKKGSNRNSEHYVVCIDNTDYAASLEKHKIYRIVRDEAARVYGDLPVIDESGEDYLYPAARFVTISVPAEVEKSFALGFRYGNIE